VTPVRVSIVVPVLDEQERVVGLLEHLRTHFAGCEIVVADGGSTDRTLDLVSRAAPLATVVRAPTGRGPQGDAGAAAATGDVLWFVHADTRPDPAALAAMAAALADAQVVGGGFRLRFDRGGPALRWLEWTSNVRARRLGWVFGDQAMFVRREHFDAVGGFRGLVLMEDLEVSRRLRSRGRLAVLDPPCVASARRFDEHGTVRMILRMQWCKLLYFRGVAPTEIRRRYTAPRRPGRWSRIRARLRPVDPAFADALARRWAELPDGARTPGQVLGRHAVGCEGTHGVFPRCDLACTPCYHSRDANRVRVDGPHTLAQVEAQMALLERERGPVAHAQLIGGEVTLLDPDDHAAALAIMRRHGREPMSMTHGDVDADHLRRLALGPDGRRRFRRLSFAVHIDSLMYGRRGIPRPPDERSLTPYRRRFVEAVGALRRHGVRSFMAHNMTVTPANLDQVPDVVRDCLPLGFGMLSFQPAAFVGDDRRWREDYRDHDADAVWARIESGAGTRLDPTLFQHGDVRCNRVAYGFRLGDRWFPLLDGDDPRDVAVRDAFLRHLGAVTFTGVPPALLAVRLARVVAHHPSVVGVATAWLVRTVRRVGARRVLRHRPRPLTFVMHSFMDAADVAPAWALTRRGETADDPRVRATQERLAACHYAMAHPEDGTVVPACVQHAVLDPAENAALRRLLPLVERGR
jgi:rSAM/selenodomain-associated transferase 2